MYSHTYRLYTGAFLCLSCLAKTVIFPSVSVCVCVLVPMKDRLALLRETMGTLTFSLPLHPPQKMKMAPVFLIATLPRQYIQDGWRDRVSVCVGREKCETEKGDDLVSQQGDGAIKENPKNHSSPSTDEALRSHWLKLSSVCGGGEYVHFKIYCTK